MKKYIFLFFLFCICFLTGLFLGPEFFSIPRIIHILSSGQSIDRTIFLKIRLPRVIAGFIVGGGLALTGAVFQAILRNPLADSYTLGVSGGASLGICIGVISGKSLSIPAFAFIGALLSIAIILLAGSRKKFSNTTLILLGVVLNFIFSSFVLLMLAVVKNEKFQEVFMWLLGNLSFFPKNLLILGSICIVLSSVVLMSYWRVFDILSIGEEKAHSLGISPDTIKRIAFILSSIIIGFCVSLSGIIGFVGLIIPHIARLIFRPSHKNVLPCSFFLGGGFLILSDGLARTLISPLEIPVGVITGFFGGIFFLFLLFKQTQKQVW